MIYKSTAKTKEIIDNYERKIKIKADGVELNPMNVVSMQISIEPAPEYSIQKAVAILKKEKLYRGLLLDDIRTGYYYEIEGALVYRGLERGNRVKFLKKKFLRKISERDFFDDDMLMFQMDLGIDHNYMHVKMRCKAKNIECFSESVYQENTILCSDTSDPGILDRPIPVMALIRVDCINEINKIIQGSPLYIKRKYYG